VRQQSVEAIGHGRAGRAAGLVARPEHEVVDRELRAVIKQLHQGLGALRGLQRVLLVDRHPGKLPPVASELIAHPGELLLPAEQLGASRLPLLTRSDLVIRHRIAPFPAVAY